MYTCYFKFCRRLILGLSVYFSCMYTSSKYWNDLIAIYFPCAWLIPSWINSTFLWKLANNDCAQSPKEETSVTRQDMNSTEDGWRQVTFLVKKICLKPLFPFILYLQWGKFVDAKVEVEMGSRWSAAHTQYLLVDG